MSNNNAQLLNFLMLRKKSSTAYLLLVFLGLLGAHRFYLNDEDYIAYIELSLSLLGLGLLIFGGVGVIFLIAAAIMLFYDIFSLPTMIKKENLKLRSEMGLSLADTANL